MADLLGKRQSSTPPPSYTKGQKLELELDQSIIAATDRSLNITPTMITTVQTDEAALTIVRMWELLAQDDRSNTGEVWPQGDKLMLSTRPQVPDEG